MIQTIIYKYKIFFLKNKRNSIIYIANNILCLNYKLIYYYLYIHIKN